MRRSIDILFAALVLVLVLPLLLVICLLIKLESSGPIFYRPNMIGWHGKAFSLFRFRTMYADARIGQSFTRVGRFLRNYSLDHLPQVFNLLRGDLTLIGPRPMEADVVNFQDPAWQQYVQIKPGLINYAIYKLGKEWTPSRSTRPALNQELELQYLQHRSIGSDVKLFLQSLWKLVTSKGNIKARGDVEPDLKRDQQIKQ